MDPNQPYPSPAGTPSPVAPTPLTYPLQPRRKKNNHLALVIGLIVSLLLLVAIISAVFVLGSQKKTPTPAANPDEQTVEPEGPQPATAVDTEQTNNAISQDITSVNDDKDLPANQLDDRTLGL